MSKYIYGIDIGGTSVKLGLFDRTFTLLEKWEIPTDKTDHGSHILGDIVASIKDHTPNLEEIYGYGFGVPGPVIKNQIQMCVNLGWGVVDIEEELKDVLENDRIAVANDANVATLGEAFIGAGHGRKNVAMITLGTGVGSGIIVDGLILEGAFGSAGEIGHLTIPQKKPLLCNCGKQGCLETVASATGVVNIFRRKAENFIGESSLLEAPYVTAKMIFDNAKDGDILANMVVDEAAYYIAYSCHVVSITTNPSTIIIGGGVSKAGEFLLARVRKEFIRLAFPPARDTKIVQATLGNDAGMYGAAELVKIYG
jgi:glucokinase